MYFTETHHSQCVEVSAFHGFTQFHSWCFILEVPYSSVVTAVVINLTLHLGNSLRGVFQFFGEKKAL